MKKYKSAALNDVCLKDPVFAPRVELAVGPMLRAVVEQTEKNGQSVIGAIPHKNCP